MGGTWDENGEYVGGGYTSIYHIQATGYIDYVKIYLPPSVIDQINEMIEMENYPVVRVEDYEGIISHRASWNYEEGYVKITLNYDNISEPKDTIYVKLCYYDEMTMQYEHFEIGEEYEQGVNNVQVYCLEE